MSALGGPHQGIAGRLEKLRPDLDSAVRLGLKHQAYFVGVCPSSLPDGWRFVSRSEIFAAVPHRRDSHDGRGRQKLIAMAGERIASAGLQGISGVCTMGARRPYESMGFAVRASLGMCKVERL